MSGHNELRRASLHPFSGCGNYCTQISQFPALPGRPKWNNLLHLKNVVVPIQVRPAKKGKPLCIHL